MPLNIPTGETVFIDANIFYYHFVSLPGLSIACKHFLHRVEQGEITGMTATAVLAEAQHKVMLAEAVQKYGLSPQGLVRRLTQPTGLLAGLSHHRIVPSTVVAMNVRIEPLTMAYCNRLLTSQSHTNYSLTMLPFWHICKHLVLPTWLQMTMTSIR